MTRSVAVKVDNDLTRRNFKLFVVALTHPYPSQEGNLKSPLLGGDSGVGINLVL